MKLVQNLLGVDGLDGQLFVVTHSTDALVNDYQKIIRMYRDEKEWYVLPAVLPSILTVK